MATVISVEEAKRRTTDIFMRSPLYRELLGLPISRALLFTGSTPDDLLDTITAVAGALKKSWHVEKLTDGTEGMAVWFEEE